MEKEGIARDPERGYLQLLPADYGLETRERSSERPVRIPLSSYYDRLRPLLAPAIAEMEKVLSGPRALERGLWPRGINALYLVGGSNRLPLIPLLLKEKFPSVEVILSDKPFTSVAMGAAIAAAERARISDIISRHFGVIRLRDSGTKEYTVKLERRADGRERTFEISRD